MKYLLPICIFVFLLSSCGQEGWPEDLKGKRTLLQSKKSEVNVLKEDILKLEKEIEELNPEAKEKQRRLVTTSSVKKRDFERFVEIQASVMSDEIVMASSETGGRILSMNLKEGQYVKKGALVATVDLDAIKKQLAEVETALILADQVYERQKRLWDQNIGSEIQYLQAKNNKERLEMSMETLKFQWTKGNVYAPGSGVVDQVFLRAGEVSAPGQPIIQILDTRKVKVVADVPEKYLPKVKLRQQVNLKFPAINHERSATVSQLGRTINPANRTFAVETLMNNTNGLLKPNLLAIMMLKDFEQKDALVIPLELVQQEVDGDSYVYVSNEGEDGQFAQKRYVETGESSEGEIVITKGLEDGDIIIVEGARGLAENELIQIKTEREDKNG